MQAGDDEPERTDTEQTVDELERKVLGDQPNAERAAADRPTEPHEPAAEPDKDVEDLPGGAGEPGGSGYEPPS